MHKFYTLLLALFCTAVLLAQTPGTLDPNFNPADNASFGNGPDGPVLASVQQPDGKIIIAGNFTNYNGHPVNQIVRIDQTGTVDPSFTAPAFTTLNNTITSVNTLLLLPGGKILVGGNFATVNGVDKKSLCLLNSNGTPDNSFNQGGTGITSGLVIVLVTSVNCSALRPDGKIVIGGQFGTYNGVAAPNLMLLNADGTPVPNFPGIVNGTGLPVNDIAVLPDNRMIVVGDIPPYRNGNVKQFLANGQPDPSFSCNTNNEIKSVCRLANGNIMIGGNIGYNTTNGQLTPGIARLLPSGALDNSFQLGSGLLRNDGLPGLVNDMVELPNGKLLVAGFFSSYNSRQVSSLILLNSNGTMDVTFQVDADLNLTPTNNSCRSITPLANGNLFVGGRMAQTDNSKRTHAFILNGLGKMVRSFNPRRGFNKIVHSITVQPDGKVISGGAFTSFNDTVNRYLVRLLPNGSRDNAFSNLMDLNGPVFATALQPDGKILVAGNFTVIQGQQKQSMLRLLPGGFLDNSFSLTGGASDSIKTIAVRPDGKILIGGAFTKAGGVATNRIALLNADGTVQSSFFPQGANGTVNDLLVRGNNQIYVAGAFTSIGGVSRAGIAKLLANGAVDNSFVPNPVINGIVNAIDSFPNGSIVLGGSFSQTLPSVTRKCITAFLPSGVIDNSFAAGAGFSVFFSGPQITDLVIQAGNRVVAGGYFSAYNNNFYSENGCLITLLADGSHDRLSPVYESATNNPDDLKMRLALRGNNVLAGGNFTTLNGSAKKRIARLLYPLTASNDEPCNAINLIAANPGDTSMVGLPQQSIEGANTTNTSAGGCGNGTTPMPDVWFKFTATKSTHFILVKGEGNFKPVATLYSGACISPIFIRCKATLNIGERLIIQERNFVPGTQYFIRIASANIATQSNQTFTIKVITPINDEACDAVTILPKAPGDTSTASSTHGSFYPSTVTQGIRGINDVWYKFTATRSTHILRPNVACQINLFRKSDCNTNVQPLGGQNFSLTSGYSNGATGFTNLTPDSVYYIQLIRYAEEIALNFELDVLSPVNDEPCTATAISPGLPSDTLLAYTNGDYHLSTFKAVSNCNGIVVDNPDVWYKFTATATRHYIQASGTEVADIFVAVYPTGICEAINTPSLFCKRNAGDVLASVENLTPGSDYFIRISRGIFVTGGIRFRLRVLTGPQNISPCRAESLIPAAVGDTTFSTATNSSLFLAGNLTNGFYKDVWYKFVATSTAHIVLLNTTGLIGHRLFKYSNANSDCNALSLIGTFNKTGLRRYSNLVIGNTYYVQVAVEQETTSDQFSITVLTPAFDEPCTAKVITPLPKGTTLCTSPITGTTKFATGLNANYPTNTDVWYQFTATDSAQVINAFCIKGQLLEINIYRGTSCGTINPTPVSIGIRGGIGPLLVGGKFFKPDSLYFIRIGNSQINGANQDTYFSFCLQSGQSNIGPCSASTIIPAATNDTSFANPVTGNLLLGQTFTRSGSLSYCPNVINPGTVQELWYKFTATAASHFIRYQGPAKAGVRLHQSACPVAINPIFCDTPLAANDVVPLTGLQVGTEYFVCFYVKQPAASILENYAMQLKLLTPPSGYNDSICNAIPLSSCADTSGHLLFATPDAIGAGCEAGNVNEVWYKFIAPPSGILSVRSTTAGFKPKVRFITLADCTNPASITSQNCDFSELMMMTDFTAGAEYYMGVGISEADAAITGNTGNFSIQLANTTVIGANYTISTTNSICQGTKVIFTGSASDAGANPGYEWLINSVFTGATGRIFVCDTLKNGDKVQVRIIPSISCLSPRTSQSTTFTVAPGTLYFKDADGDGFGRAGTDTIACTPPIGYVTNSNDCNDAANTANRSFGFYVDADGDGFGVNPLVQVCASGATPAPAGYSLNNLDLDDNDASKNPHAPRAEYFIDIDPGPGKGTALPFTSGLDSIKVQTSIGTENLGAGFHTLGIRVFSQGSWSLFESRGFYLSDLQNNAADIAAAEFFVDADPGAGNGNLIGFTVNNDTTNAKFSVPVSGLAGGFHNLAVRFKDANGKWSLFENRGFYIDSIGNDEALPTAAEYFIDIDPGAGNGIPIATPFPADTLQINDLVATGSLSPGFHNLAIRLKDSNGKWGLFENRGFYLEAPEPAANPIVAAEYFLTTDPGTGTGNNLPLGASADSIGGAYTVSIPASVTAGTYLMGSRVKDSKGQWSHFEYDTVTVANNSTNTTVLFTSICAGTGTILPFTASGTYNANNTFTAQLSNAEGDFSNTTTIGTFAGTNGGNMPITIPATTTPGIRYRIRIISSSPTGAAIIAANGFSVNGTISTDDATASQMLTPQPNFLLDAQCRLLTALLPGGSNPVAGMVTGQVWVEDNVPLNNQVPFVGRHYQITPVTNATTATATVTLYFTQAEFTAYNNHPNTTPATRLPAGPTDVDGISRLLVIKFTGSSNNGTGMPNSYTGDTTAIDPEDSDIVWNNSLQRWEVSFDVTGFSGFIVTAAPNILIGPLPAYSYWTGNVSTDWFNAANWSNGVPTATGTAIIPGGRPNYPIILQSTTVKSLEVEEEASVICETGVQLSITGKQQSAR